MSEFSDLLKERKLARMRMGQESCEIVDIPSDPEMRVALVPLTEKEMQEGITAAAALHAPGDNMAAAILRDRHRQCCDMWHSARLTNDLQVKAFDSVEQMVEVLDNVDINVLGERYILMVDESSPAVDGLSDADLADLKKDFGTIPWSELSGKRWAAVKLCHSVLFPGQLLDRSLGSTSTSSSTPTSEEIEPIPTVATS
jgi:hypothetical protein